MTTFLRLLADKDKAEGLLAACDALRHGETEAQVYEIDPASFRTVPGAPFAYWVSDAVRGLFQRLPPFESDGRTARVGLQTSDDFRFVRTWWEVDADPERWPNFAKGGAYSPFYADIYLVVNWAGNGAELDAFAGSVIRNPGYYRRPGLTWPLRTQRFGMRALPPSCLFGHKGPVASFEGGRADSALSALSLSLSRPFILLMGLRLNAADRTARSFEVGVIQDTPLPSPAPRQSEALSELARRAWSLKRTLDTVEETSHAFLLPSALRSRLGDYDPPAIEAELEKIQHEIDEIAFDLYGFSEADRAAALGLTDADVVEESEEEPSEVDDEEENAAPADAEDALLSWAVGVAFGRFDWRLATGERAAPPEPDPFDPLPARSPGMLEEGAEPFHSHSGILVDDGGHPHDLARLVEAVLERVNVPAPDDVRRWLGREFFPFHLQRYSKSRRKAPIYWPLATASGSYTLWVYYPELTTQTLYTAVNDFVEPKLAQVGEESAALRGKAVRSREEERQYEALQALEVELYELRDTLLRVAQSYHPHHDDGVQITAARLWPLFRHKPWQRLLKETWTKLENGDYDWAHLAMACWPQRVQEKCRKDKSLAIAHGLEHLYVEPEAKPARKKRGRKTAADA